MIGPLVIDQLTVGAAAVTVSLGGAFLTIRWYVAPAPSRGRHRAPFRPLRRVLPVTGWCWAERRITRQARTDVASELVCASCGHIIPGGGR